MKRNKFLKLLSSICGVVAICGAFALGLFGEKKNLEIKAAEIDISSSSISNTINYNSNFLVQNGDIYEFRVGSESSCTLYINGDVTLRRNFDSDNVVKYKYVYHFSDITLVNNDIDGLGFTFYQNGTSNIYLSTDYFDDVRESVSFRIKILRFRYEYWNYYQQTDYGRMVYELYDDNLSEVFYTSPEIPVIPHYYNGLPGTYEFVNNSYFYNVSYNAPYLYETFNSHNNVRIDDVTYSSSIWLYRSYFSTTSTDYENGYSIGYSSGYTDGYNQGFSGGYTSGYDNGYNDGVVSQQPFIDNAYNTGYNTGYADGVNSNGTAVTIFSGILQIGMLPINFFLSILNFEVFGINISGFIKAILTVCLTIIVVKTVLGNSGGGA